MRDPKLIGDSSSSGGQLSADEARQLRRRLLQQRQTVIFGWILAALLLVFLVCLPFALGVIELPIGNSFQTAAPTREELPPCPPEGEAVPFDKVSVSIYNATSRSGLAGQTADQLESLGVNVEKVANHATAYLGSVQILCGPKGVGAAYSVARALPEAQVKLVKRDTPAVDIILGEDFAGALSKADFLASPGQIARPAHCEPVDN